MSYQHLQRSQAGFSAAELELVREADSPLVAFFFGLKPEDKHRIKVDWGVFMEAMLSHILIGVPVLILCEFSLDWCHVRGIGCPECANQS